MANISVDRTIPKPQDNASDGLDGIGFTYFWGNSPALDLLGDPQASAFGVAAMGVSPGQQYKDESRDKDPFEDEFSEPKPEVIEPKPLPGDGPINILITGGADMRHVLKTVGSRCGGGKGPKIRFYLHETSHEVLARHLLFAEIMNNTSLLVRERMELFLSIYGNTLIREKDSRYIANIVDELIELVTSNSEHPLAEVLDFESLKFKDRDAIQQVLRGWKDDVPFDIEALREQRARGYYRERYDYRKNMMDWDYQTHIKEKAGIINWFHYKAFCFEGVAFETRLASYNTPNRTLASYTEAKDRSKGTSVQVRGFWGDIINSPFYAFSITTNPVDRPRLFKISGSQYRHTETDIAEFNITDYLTQMDVGEEVHLPPERPEEHVFPYASPLEEMRPKVEEVKEEDEAPKTTEAQKKGRRRVRKQFPPLSAAFQDNRVQVILLAGDLRDQLKKRKYRGHFHRAFLGSMAVMPLFQDAQLGPGSTTDPFKSTDPTAVVRIRQPPNVEKPNLLGKFKEDSSFASAFAEGAEVIAETMKYQAHFEAIQRLAYRHRVAQAAHLFGWRCEDERRAIPRMEHDMKEKTAQQIERYATDFLRFVTGPAPEPLPDDSQHLAGSDLDALLLP
eukprot:CAMPEP_0206597298 /NCGR_PEP_ID=MMETSP0325_2-20121206/44033_1 /ASSEMBLY_ACC=CAM_ASM_000347 /TAXON_ID=2866 /ORGANISM="Crypthecodinium cohnii, Strain Seligo" /LENGTH=619 /DNA_ID=CAMNT_0054108217 /DNA_START=15 /DNA_END=1874 /DNA_ORIENTATION=-